LSHVPFDAAYAPRNLVNNLCSLSLMNISNPQSLEASNKLVHVISKPLSFENSFFNILQECFCKMWWIQDGSHEVGFSSFILTRIWKPSKNFYNQVTSFFSKFVSIISHWWKWTESWPSIWKVWSAISLIVGSYVIRIVVRPCFARPPWPSIIIIYH
jgi:hypothetical protein